MRHVRRLWAVLVVAVGIGCGAESPVALDAEQPALHAGQPTAQQQFPLEILPGAALEIPAIGTGFSAPAEKYMGRCVVGRVVHLPAADAAATLKVTSMLDGDKAQQQLGFQLGSKAHFGIGKGSLQAQAASAMTRDAFSSVWVLSVSYVSEAMELDFDSPIRPSVVGEAALASDAWHRECGDEFIYQVQKGAQLFVVYRLDYKSENLKEQVEAQAQGQRSVVEINGQLKQLSDQLARHASLSLEVYQFGGDPTRLGGVITGPSANLVQAEAAARAVIQCGTDNLAACDALLTQALVYATSLTAPDAFAQQVQRSANPTLYVTAPWSRLGHTPTRVPTDHPVQAARLGLAIAFDRTLAAKKRVELLLGSDWIDAPQRDELLPWRTALAYQQGRILGLVAACYDDIQQDPNAPASYTPSSRARCVEAEAKLTQELTLPPAHILRGAVERAIWRTWQDKLGGQGEDPARRTQTVGQVTCGFAQEQAICGFKGSRGATATVLDGPIYDTWAHLPDSVRETYAHHPDGHGGQQDDIAWAGFAPQGAVFAPTDGRDEGLFLGGPLWRCWRSQAHRLGMPVTTLAESHEGIDTAALSDGELGVFSDAPHVCTLLPNAALVAWQQHGGLHSCLGAPRPQQPRVQPGGEQVSCFAGGHVTVDAATGLGRARCPWFRHAACRSL